MNRRSYLGLAAGALVTVTGCGGDSTRPVDSTPTPTPDEPQLEAAVETDRYLVHSYAQRPIDRAIDPDQVTPLTTVSQPLRGALRTAVSGGYRSDQVSRALLLGIDQFRVNSVGYRFLPYLSVNGTPYAFDPTVPVFTARLEFGVEDPDPARTVGHDVLGELAEPVSDFVRTMAAFTTHAPRDTYRRSVVPDEVTEFLDRYDFVRDPDGVGRIVTERVDPGPPYTITTSELTAEDLWGHPVHPPDSLPDPLRRFLRTVVASERRAPVYRSGRTEHRTDSLPPTYGDHFGPEHGPTFGAYADFDGTLYAFRAMEARREEIPIAVSAAPVGQRTFSVNVERSSAGAKPRIDGPIELVSPGALPSVLWVLAGSERHLLDSDAYGSTWWSDKDGSLGGRIEETARSTVGSGGSLSATYRIPDAVAGGTYTAWGLLRASWTPTGENRATPPFPYPFQVRLRVPSASTT